MSNIKVCRIVLICAAYATVTLCARQQFACPDDGNKYPKYCPRDGDKTELTKCCRTADHKPNCCKPPPPSSRKATVCLGGSNYPKYCPRDDDDIELTTCCVTEDNKPNCCKPPVAGKEVTICPKGYSIPHCPGKGDAHDLKYCCRLMKGSNTTDRCCGSSWVMTDPLTADADREDAVAPWRIGVIVLSVLFLLLLGGFITIITIYCQCPCRRLPAMHESGIFGSLCAMPTENKY